MKRNLFRRITALTVAGISAITVASCGAKPSPMETIEDAVEVNIDNLADSEIVSNIEKFYTGGSLELKGNLSKIIELATGAPMDLDASLKMYNDMDAATPASAIVAALGMNGTTLIDLAVYFTQTNLALKSGTLLGDDAYGITYAGAKEKFETSIFGPDGEYAIDVEEIENLFAYFETLSTSSFDVQIAENIGKSLENLVDELKPVIYKALENHGDTKIVDGTVTLAENEVKTVDVTFNYDANGIINVTKDILTAVKDSKNLKPAIEAVCAYIEEYNSYAAILDSQSSVTIPEFSADEAYSEITTVINDALASHEESVLSEEELPTINLSAVAHIAKKTGELLSVSFALTTDDTPDATVDLILATSHSPAWKLGMKVDGVEGTEVAIAYDVITSTDTAFESALNVTVSGTTTSFFTLKWDKTTGEYSVVLSDVINGDTIGAVEGKYVADKNTKTLSASKITVEGETVDIGEIALVVTYEDQMPIIESFTEIFDLTAEDVQVIGTKIFSGIGSLAYLFS